MTYYGFQKQQQIASVNALLQFAGLPILHAYFLQGMSPKAYLGRALTFIEDTQKSFVNRRSVKTGAFLERWHMDGSQAAWIDHIEEKNNITGEYTEYMRTLGFVDRILPKRIKVDAVCILGSTTESMEERFSYADTLMRTYNLEAKHLILLAGERMVYVMRDGVLTLDTTSDGSEKDLLQIASTKKLRGVQELTETHLIEAVYEKIKTTSPLGKLDVHVLDTPAGKLPRPTTETTMLYLLQWLKKNPSYGIEHIVFITNQPHVQVQGKSIESIAYYYMPSLHVEVVGDKARHASLKSEVMALGATFFVGFPRTLDKMGVHSIDLETLNTLQDLYKNNPGLLAHITSLYSPKFTSNDAVESSGRKIK